MKVIIDLCIVPIGVGVSLTKYIASCERIIKQSGLSHSLHAYGTNIEGEWDEVFKVVKECHELLHKEGAPRITTTIKCGTRTDKNQSMVDKVTQVEALLKHDL